MDGTFDGQLTTQNCELETHGSSRQFLQPETVSEGEGEAELTVAGDLHQNLNHFGFGFLFE